MVDLLKQSTAITVKLGPFVDETDGYTAETALTIGQADIRLSKNGGDFAQTNDATGATHDESGWYGLPLDSTDTGTLGRLTVYVHESGARPVWREFMVVPANVYDSFISGSDYLQTDVQEIEGSDATNQINAEVVDTLATDTYAELGSVPAATSSLKDKINWLFALARNKLTQTTTTQTLRDDGDSGNIGTAAVSDDGTTATRGEWT